MGKEQKQPNQNCCICSFSGYIESLVIKNFILTALKAKEDVSTDNEKHHDKFIVYSTGCKSFKASHTTPEIHLKHCTSWQHIFHAILFQLHRESMRIAWFWSEVLMEQSLWNTQTWCSVIKFLSNSSHHHSKHTLGVEPFPQWTLALLLLQISILHLVCDPLRHKAEGKKSPMMVHINLCYSACTPQTQQHHQDFFKACVGLSS